MIGLAPGVMTTWSGVNGNAARLGDVVRDRFTRLQNPGRRRVVGVAVAQRPDRRLLDVLGCVKIRLADLQVNDRAPLRLERAGAREHLERGLRAEIRHPLREGRARRSGRALLRRH